MDIRWLAVAASLLVSVYTLLLPEVPNDDAYVYIRTAEIYLANGLGAAIEHYTWAGYSVVVAELSRTGIPLLQSALIVNALFFALLVYSFISIVAFLDSSRRILALAALTILLYPELNEFRYMVIRDVGFWSLGLFAVWQFLRYRNDPDFKPALLFTAALIAATVFRVEAVVYLAIMPLTLLLDRRNRQVEQIGNFWRLAAVAYGSLLAVLLVFIVSGVNPISLGIEFLSVYRPIIENTFNPNPADTAELGRLLFGDHGAAFSGDYMTAVIMTGLLVILAMTIFSGISGAYFWVLAYGAVKRYWNFSRPQSNSLLAFAAINVAILVVFLYVTRFLSSRYAIPLCLILVTQLPFVVARTLDAASELKSAKLLRNFVILFFVFCAFDAYISFGRSKAYLQDSVDYVSAHIQPGQDIWTNNHSIAFSSGRVIEYDEVPRIFSSDQINAAAPGDFIVLEMIYDVRQLLNQDDVRARLEFVTAFPNEREQAVAIYRRVAP